jgi:enoyl-CoA hydratase/carnithine racemase
MTEASEDAVVTEVDGNVLLITLNRPRARNAINSALGQGLLAAVNQLDKDPELRVGVLAGNGPTFCAGMDLKEFAATGVPKGLFEFLARGSKKPLIAAVEGHVLGGGLELALACDLIAAGENATFGIPEAKVGLLAAGGALIRLPRRLPPAVAMELALTGQAISATDAHAHGLVNRVAPHGQALAAARTLAAAISLNAPLSLTASKAIIVEAQGCSETEGWEIQRKHVSTVFKSGDAREGARAFKEKRRPEWTGR